MNKDAMGGVLLCILSACLMGWLITYIFNLGGGIIIAAAIAGFFLGTVILTKVTDSRSRRKNNE